MIGFDRNAERLQDNVDHGTRAARRHVVFSICSPPLLLLFFPRLSAWSQLAYIVLALGEILSLREMPERL